MSPDITSHFKKASKVGWGSQGIGEEIRRAFTEFQVGDAECGGLEWYFGVLFSNSHLYLSANDEILDIFWCGWLLQKLHKSKCPSVTVILPHFEVTNNILELKYRFLKNGSCN